MRLPAVGQAKKGSFTSWPKIFVDRSSGGLSPASTSKWNSYSRYASLLRRIVTSSSPPLSRYPKHMGCGILID